MRILGIALAVFALLGLGAGWGLGAGMTAVIGAAALAAALLMISPLPMSSFFKILAGLFAVETVAFGLIDVATATDKWPDALKDYATPQYLPLATALFIVALYAIDRIPFVKRMMTIADPVFDAWTPLGLKFGPLGVRTLPIGLFSRICIVFIVLLNQLQVALNVRLNFFQRDFFDAMQVPDEEHRIAFWHQLLDVFTPIAFTIIAVGLVDFFVGSIFVLNWRRWMTASYTARWLTGSMHYKLALSGDSTDNPDQRISQDISGFINGTNLGSVSGGASVGFYNYTIQAISTATNLVSFSVILWSISAAMKVPVFGVEVSGFLFWVAFLYAIFASGLLQMIGRRLSAILFRQQAVEANFRFGLARVREYAEQIALLKGEDRELARSSGAFGEVYATIRRNINLRFLISLFQSAYGQVSNILPYVIVAPFYYLKLVTLGVFNQTADAFGNVNSAMNFFIDRYTGLADFSATINRLTTFDAAFAKAAALSKSSPISAGVSADADLRTPNLELALPDGRKLARLGDLLLVPQEPTLVVGPSGAGKSTLFRAIAGLWPYGSGEIKQPDHAKLMLLPQRPYIPIGPLRDAVAYPAAGDSVSEATLKATLLKVGLPALVGRLDESDNWQMRLSGGEQQRLAVARALIAKPDWLFLDEATASLDEASEAALYKTIATELPGATLVSIGHRSTLAAFHKRRVELAPGADGVATIAG